MRHDLAWIRALSDAKLQELPPADDALAHDPGHLGEWLTLTASHPKYWARIFTAATHKACRQDAQGVPPVPPGVHLMPTQVPTRIDAQDEGRHAIPPAGHRAHASRPHHTAVHQPRQRHPPKSVLPIPRRHHTCCRPARLHNPSVECTPWHFACDTSCVICLHQHHTRSRLVRHLQRRGSTCLIALLHHYQPPIDNAAHDSTHNPISNENLPCLAAAVRLQGPLPHHNIRHRSALHPFIDDDQQDITPPSLSRLPPA